MSADYGDYYNLAKRIDETFIEIDGDICSELHKNDSEYIAMLHDVLRLQKEFPIIQKIVEGAGAVNLSMEEHEALTQYFSLKNDMENIERKQIYYRGHTDNYAYLTEIAGFHIG